MALEKKYSHRRLKAVPASVLKRKSRESLTRLWLDHNDIRSIPAKFALMSRLTFLDLSANLLTKLPEVILQLDSLQELRISKNPNTLQMYTSPLAMPEDWQNLTKTLLALEWPVVNQYDVHRFLELQSLSRISFTVAVHMTPRNDLQVRTTCYREVAYRARHDLRLSIRSEAYLLTELPKP